MEVKDFTELGFNKNEALVYLSLIKFGETSAHKIIQDTKFHKNIVYDNLEKLIDRGLVTYIKKEGRKVFKLTSPHMLPQLFEDQQNEIQLQKQKADKLAKQIAKISKQSKHEQEASIGKGIKAIKTFYKESLEGGDYVVFGAPGKSLELIGETFWKNHNLKRKEKGIKVRMIFNQDLKKYGKEIEDSYTKVRYFSKEFEPQTETHIQDDIIGIIVWTEEPVLFTIQEPNVAKSYMQYFENMWKKAN